jgi:hypothetical protein
MQPPPQQVLHQQTSCFQVPAGLIDDLLISLKVLAASIVSLKTMERVAVLEPQPFVFVVLNLTVAKVDSMGLVVRI